MVGEKLLCQRNRLVGIARGSRRVRQPDREIIGPVAARGGGGIGCGGVVRDAAEVRRVEFRARVALRSGAGAVKASSASARCASGARGCDGIFGSGTPVGNRPRAGGLPDRRGNFGRLARDLPPARTPHGKRAARKIRDRTPARSPQTGPKSPARSQPSTALNAAASACGPVPRRAASVSKRSAAWTLSCCARLTRASSASISVRHVAGAADDPPSEGPGLAATTRRACSSASRAVSGLTQVQTQRSEVEQGAHLQRVIGKTCLETGEDFFRSVVASGMCASSRARVSWAKASRPGSVSSSDQWRSTERSGVEPRQVEEFEPGANVCARKIFCG